MRQNHSKCVLGIIAVMLFAAIVLVAGIAIKPRPLIIWNASDSVPIGFYYVDKRQPQIGDIAVIAPSGWVRLYALSRGYLPSNVWLLKPVFAVSRSVVCRFGPYVFVDGKLVARAKTFDRAKRILLVWTGCRTLKSDEIFVLAKPRNSFDSRYFGPISRVRVIGTAIRISFR